MAITTNANRQGNTGVDQEYLTEMVDGLLKAIYVLANKLDADDGVTATDFTADVENIIASGAAPIGFDAVSTVVQAAIA